MMSLKLHCHATVWVLATDLRLATCQEEKVYTLDTEESVTDRLSYGRGP